MPFGDRVLQRGPVRAARSIGGAGVVNASWLLCGRKRNGRVDPGGGRRILPGATRRREMRRHGLRVSKRVRGRASVCVKPSRLAGLCGRRWLRCGEFFLKRALWQAAAILLRRGALWRGRWQWLVWSNGRRVCLRGCDAFLRGQIRRPECLALFLDAHLCGRASVFVFRA